MKKEKTIDTLVDDIYTLLGSDTAIDIPDDLAQDFADRMYAFAKNRVGGEKSFESRLRMSNIGRPCIRQTWLEVHQPKLMEKLQPAVFNKFYFGDITEEFLLFLCEAAGHRVEGRQDVMEIGGVKGSRDAVIDGVLVDVKSASTFSFKKFNEGNLTEDDPFGYLGQIQTYLAASQDDPLVTDKERCAFLVMDKTLGHICLDIYGRVNFDVEALTKEKVKIIDDKDNIPDRAFKPVEDGKSGNEKLGLNCSYCSAKWACYPDLRAFVYSNGPRYLTKVVRQPDVPEIDNPNK